MKYQIHTIYSSQDKKGRETNNVMLKTYWQHVAEGLGTPNMKEYELRGIERLSDTYNSSWVEGKGPRKVPSWNHVEGWKRVLGRCCWVKKYIEHELCTIVVRGTTYSKQKHPLGWGGGGEVSNLTGYRSADSWIAGEGWNIPLKSCLGRARAMRREGGRRGGGGWVEVRTEQNFT